MRGRILIAMAFALTAFSSTVLAEGTIVRWNRVEGVIGADLTEVRVGPIVATGRWRTTGGGRVQLDLETGFLSVRVKGISCANHYGNCPLGSTSPAGGKGIATVVCNSTERFGPISWVNSPLVVNPVPGSFIYQGFLDLPAACRDHPEDLVFLIRHQEDAPPFYGAFMLYGAERDIQ